MVIYIVWQCLSSNRIDKYTPNHICNTYESCEPFSCKVHQEMAEKALSVMRRHLEVLSGPLIVLSLVDTCLPQATREAIGMKLLTLQDEWNPGAMPIRRAAASHDLISSEGALGEDWHEVN